MKLVKLPTKPFIQNMSRDQLEALVQWMMENHNSAPSDYDIAFVIWNHEVLKNRQRMQEVCDREKRPGIDIQETLELHRQFEYCMEIDKAISDFYKKNKQKFAWEEA